MLISLELVLLFITALAVGIIGNIAGIGGGVLIMNNKTSSSEISINVFCWLSLKLFL